MGVKQLLPSKSHNFHLNCFIGVNIFTASFPNVLKQSHVRYVLYIYVHIYWPRKKCIIYHRYVLYIVYIFHLNCFQGVNIFIVSFPTHAVLFQIAPRRNTKGHENIEKISILEWKDYTWRPFPRIKSNENMRNPAEFFH